jgi:hypothetical protein
MEVGGWEGCGVGFNYTVFCVRVYTMQIRPLFYPSPVFFGLTLLSHPPPPPPSLFDNDFLKIIFEKENDDIYPAVMVGENPNFHPN